MLFGRAQSPSRDDTRHPEDKALINAINRVQAMIWFSPEGTILDANDLFCAVVGYRKTEIVGKSHRIFVDRDYANSADYAAFWRVLASGDVHDGQYKRYRKDGSEIWIQATYNPVFDEAGSVVKIVKFATDISKRRQTIDTILQVFQQSAGGDITARVPGIASGELRTLTEQFNQDLDKKEALIREIADLSGQIGGASASLARHARDTAEGVDTQSEGLARTLDAVRSVETLVRETDNSIRQSRDKADDADVKSGEGHRVVENATEVMSRIKEGSTRIENIVGVIDAIAFQTNLLSLNASVEAARAGEAGRGFAVVAQEVRNLAQDTAREASQIRELVRQSVDDIAEGATVVEQVGVVLSDIKAAVGHVVQHTAEINKRCHAQVEGIAEASEALASLEEAGRRAAQSAQENSNSVDDLAQRADDLDKLVAMFGITSETDIRAGPFLRAVS